MSRALALLIAGVLTASSKHPLILRGLFNVSNDGVICTSLLPAREISKVDVLVLVFDTLTAPPSFSIVNGSVRNEFLCKCIPDFCACAVLGCTSMYVALAVV